MTTGVKRPVPYIQKIQETMLFLSKKKKAIFLGQSVKYPGSSIFESLKTVPKNKKIELPVFEDVQMGLTLGLALENYFPIFPCSLIGS